MASLIQNELDITIMKHHFWTDSKVVLSYLQSNSRRFKTFVANQVQQIKSSTSIDDWKYVKSLDNPADIASRELNPNESDKIDVLRPTFLREPQDKRESSEVTTDVNEDDIELKKVNIISTSLPNRFFQLITNVSCWNKMKRIVA